MEQQKIISFYKKMGMCYGSCKIIYEKGNNGIYKKQVDYKSGWQHLGPFFNKELNGFYIVTGKKSNITVIDIDNLENEQGIFMNNECDKYCNMKVKTKKVFIIILNITRIYLQQVIKKWKLIVEITMLIFFVLHAIIKMKMEINFVINY